MSSRGADLAPQLALHAARVRPPPRRPPSARRRNRRPPARSSRVRAGFRGAACAGTVAVSVTASWPLVRPRRGVVGPQHGHRQRARPRKRRRAAGGEPVQRRLPVRRVHDRAVRGALRGGEPRSARCTVRRPASPRGPKGQAARPAATGAPRGRRAAAPRPPRCRPPPRCRRPAARPPPGRPATSRSVTSASKRNSTLRSRHRSYTARPAPARRRVRTRGRRSPPDTAVRPPTPGLRAGPRRGPALALQQRHQPRVAQFRGGDPGQRRPARPGRGPA